MSEPAVSGGEPQTPPRSAGLTSTEAAGRLRQYGPNTLPLKPIAPAWRRYAAQMSHFFAVMLWIAGVLSILASMPQLGFAIFVVIVLNGTFAFLQEHRAERAAEKLRGLLPLRAIVLRDGAPVTVDAAQIVPGDLLLLSAGDRVPADVQIFEASGLSLDVSTLTGESVPVPLEAGGTAFAGSLAVEGQGRGVVLATGAATRLASIAQRTYGGERPRTPLARELARVVRLISWAATGTGVVFVALAALVGIRLTDAFLFALGVVVALVPEGLLPTLTLSLAWSAQRMAARKALVRKLDAVETLGSTTFICTDKTGTLTLNQMSVVEVWTPRGSAVIEGRGYDPQGVVRAEPGALSALRDLAVSSRYCSTGRAVLRDRVWTAQGNPLEVALDVFARRMQIEASPDQVIRFFPFDPRRRRMSAVAAGWLHVKGAPDALLPCCANPGSASQAVERMAARGLHVIAVARRPWPASEAGTTATAIERDLELLGLVGIEDPPRPEVAAAIAACRRAGVKVAMVTGDHPATARAIAAQTGLLTSGALVIEGRDLPEDEALLGALVDRDGIVVSRVTPEDKLRIARALQARGHVVAMTGDGVNDGPALRQASIGIAMGMSGTDVAREAADLVLLDDNFATIVAAIEQGRAAFANMRRFLTYHLTDNVAELAPFAVWALSGGRFPLALSVLQVLALDIGTDVLPALALGMEAPGTRIMERPPHGRHLLDRSVLTRAFALLGPVEALVELAAFLVTTMWFGWRPGAPFPAAEALASASGAAFSAVVVGQMATAFACRSESRPLQALGWFTNPHLVGAVMAELGLLLGFLYLPPLARLLGHAPPLAIGWLSAALTFPAVLAADAIYKRWRHG